MLARSDRKQGPYHGRVRLGETSPLKVLGSLYMKGMAAAHHLVVGHGQVTAGYGKQIAQEVQRLMQHSFTGGIRVVQCVRKDAVKAVLGPKLGRIAVKQP